jgi:hypothetical protein
VIAAIAAIFDWRYGIKGKAHGQESAVRGYQLAAKGSAPHLGGSIAALEGSNATSLIGPYRINFSGFLSLLS